MFRDYAPRPAPVGYDPGRTIYVVGPSVKGPVREPVRVSSRASVLEIFGAEESSPLSRALCQGIETESTLTWVGVRCCGSYATTEIFGDLDGEIVPVLTFRSLDGGDHFNGLLVYIDTGSELVISTLDGTQKRYRLVDFPTLGALADAVNGDTAQGYGSLWAGTPAADRSVDIITYLGPTEATGGAYGWPVLKNQLFLDIYDTMALLEGQPIDYLVLAGAYFDDYHTADSYGESYYGEAVYSSDDDHLTLWDEALNQPATFHGLLVEFGNRQEVVGIYTHGIVACRPVKNLGWLQIDGGQPYLDALVEATALKERTGLSAGAPAAQQDLGHRLSIVAGELIFQEGKPGQYAGTSEAAYAAVLSRTGPKESTTNQPVGPIKSALWTVDRAQSQQLADVGIITFQQSVRRGLVVHAGVTPSLNEDLHEIANVRQIQLCYAVLEETLDRHRGGNMTALMRSGQLRRDVESDLNEMKRAGIIVDFVLDVRFDVPRRSAVVAVGLQPLYMVQTVKSQAQIQLA